MYDNATHNHSFVSSSDINGTDVYGSDGSKIGSIDHLVIDKSSGKVAYAVMGFGGFLGLGQDHHSIPWGALKYDTAYEGFATDITPEQLQGAPERPNDWASNRDWEQRTFDDYRLPYYWM
jgi:sporulation protein YlmC with PRC-barrel domain